MGNKIRLFEDGTREHRADEWDNGAEAYTEENVPPDQKGLAWSVVDIDEHLAANPDPEPGPDPRIAKIDGMGISAADKATLKDVLGVK